MSGTLHFGKIRSVTAKEIAEPEDSGNGYYSYNYYILPFTGTVNQKELGKISCLLHEKNYCYPFNSMGFTRVFKQEDNSGEIVYCVTYHHGD